jgi:hypothetical protein
MNGKRAQYDFSLLIFSAARFRGTCMAMAKVKLGIFL